jgi:hypothetical protein
LGCVCISHLASRVSCILFYLSSREVADSKYFSIYSIRQKSNLSGTR